MQFGKNRFLMLDNRELNYKKIVAGIVFAALIVTIAKLFFENSSLEGKLSLATHNVETLSTQLSQSQADLKAKEDLFRQQMEQLKAEGDNRTAAFAKQAAKCVPLMQKFDVKN